MMRIDFTPVRNGEVSLLDFARNFALDDLRAATNTYTDLIYDAIKDATDAEITYEPFDPDAHDPHAITIEQRIGWNVAHVVLHVTASNEEGAVISSLLARGIPVRGRLRYEPDWRTYTTLEQTLQRLEESRRQCLAYLDTWPNQPLLGVYREPSPRFAERVGLVNAPAAYLFGLRHADDHVDQFGKTLEQARAALQYAVRS